MFKTAIITNIITKLLLYTKNSVILLLLLRILKVFVSSGETDETKFFAIVDVGMVAEALNGLKARESSVLIDELASEILEILGETNEIDGESELERLRDQGVLQSIEFE